MLASPSSLTLRPSPSPLAPRVATPPEGRAGSWEPAGCRRQQLLSEALGRGTDAHPARALCQGPRLSCLGRSCLCVHGGCVCACVRVHTCALTCVCVTVFAGQ